jgi:hypothetical protein
VAERKQTAAKPKPQSQGGGVKGALTRKLGPLPFWAWAAIGAAGLYWYRHRTASGAAATTGAASTTPLAGSSSGLGGALGDSGSGGGGSSAPADTTTPGTTPITGVAGISGVIPDVTGASLTAASTNTPPGYQFPTAASDPNFAADAAAKSAAAAAAGAAQRFGGVTGTQTLSSGATLTTYASGREVEQAPGKSAYVVASGGSSTGAKTAAKVSTPVAAPKPAAAPKAAKKPTAQVARNVKAG